MAGPEDQRRRGQEGEDLFEDLDQFFAPLEEGEWPAEDQGEGPSSGTPGEPESQEPEGPVEDWDLEIEVPEEEELLAEGLGPPEGPGDAAGEEQAAEGVPGQEAPGPPPPPADEPPGVDQEPGGGEPPEEGAGEPLTVEDLSVAPPEYEALPPAHEEDDEDLAAAELFAEPEPAPEPVDALAAEREPEPEAEQAPEPEAVEAAAEHFATGMRESPEEVERELLADLDTAADETATIHSGPPATAAPPAPPPAWQEGAEQIEERLAEGPAPPPGGRNVIAAFASGILLAIAVIALLVIGEGPVAVFAGLVILLGQAELYAVMRTRRLQPATLLGLTCGALLLAGAYIRGPAGGLLGLVLAIGLVVLWYMAAPAASRRSTTLNVGATILGVAYVPFLASFALLLLAFPGDLGRNTFLVVLGLTVLYDVIAYAVGTLWGNRPLAPTISPNKSWEGVIGATLGVLVVALAIVPAIEPFTSSRAVGLALVIAVVAPIGDLVESAIKRDLGVKDMGTILPGHGGILDRIDAILFTAPAAYYFLQASF
jgi:phosphatidate cytidylyltransferase